MVGFLWKAVHHHPGPPSGVESVKKGNREHQTTFEYLTGVELEAQLANQVDAVERVWRQREEDFRWYGL